MNKYSFTSSFLIYRTSISFSCLIVLARISSMVLDRNGKDILTLFPTKEKASSLLPLNMLATVVLEMFLNKVQ